MKDSFTLLEILIVVSLIIVLAVLAILLLNPWEQAAKARDAKRKHDLELIRKVIEDYYNDKGCYPPPSAICYNSATNICTSTGTKTLTSQTCNICGSDSSSPSFSPYLQTLPCDPEQPTKKYLYQIEVTNGTSGPTCSLLTSSNSCATWFRIYTELDRWTNDTDSASLGCLGGGCGINPTQVPTTTPAYGYDYGLSSPNISIEKSDRFFCFSVNQGGPNSCDDCGADFSTCYTNDGCAVKSKIYGSYSGCCSANGLCP